MHLNNCSNCPNYGVLKLVPQQDSEYLCVACYNFKQFEKGDPYVCNYCSMTCLRAHGYIACDSCHNLMSNNYGIPLINLKNQHKFSHTLAELISEKK